MSIYHPGDAELLRAEIAAAAARMIAEDGADYGSAKRKAARQILGDRRVRGDVLPDNAQVEDEVRQYQALFYGDTQPARLEHLRRVALQVMMQLEDFHPHVTGAVLNGTAGDHSDIYLQTFADSTKEVELRLINAGIRYETSESPHFRLPDHWVPVVSFMVGKEAVHVALYHFDDLKGARRSRDGRRERIDAQALRELIEAEPGKAPSDHAA